VAGRSDTELGVVPDNVVADGAVMPYLRQFQCSQVRSDEGMQTQHAHTLRYAERIVTTNESRQLVQGSHDLVM